MAVTATILPIGSGYNRTSINTNFTNIQTALANALSRDGHSPNEMTADIDLNSNDLLNAGLVETTRLVIAGDEFFTSEAVAKGDAATIAIGSVATGDAGTSVIVTNSGTTAEAILNFTIPKGDTGLSGAGSGDMVAAQNLNDVVDKPTAFTNIKQAASETATGVVELATTTEASTGTDTTRAVTAAGVLASITANIPGIPQNSQSAAYTLVLTDDQTHIFHPSADTTARIWTIPANASVAFPVGTAVTFINQNSGGVITIAITTDTMRLAGAGTTGSRTLAANGIATAIKITSTEWIISGTGLT